MSTYSITKNRSYEVRRQIALALGAPLAHDFTVARYDADVDLELADGSYGLLESTSNAGFRGIECSYLDGDGNRRHCSMGEIARWEVVR